MVLVKLIELIVDICSAFERFIESRQLYLAGLSEVLANLIILNFEQGDVLIACNHKRTYRHENC